MLIKKANLVPLTKNPVCGDLVTVSPWYAYFLSMKDLTHANVNHVGILSVLKHIEYVDSSYKLTESGKEIFDFYEAVESIDLPVYITHEHDSKYSLIGIETGIMFSRPEKKLNLDNLFSIKGDKLGMLLKSHLKFQKDLMPNCC